MGVTLSFRTKYYSNFPEIGQHELFGKLLFDLPLYICQPYLSILIYSIIIFIILGIKSPPPGGFAQPFEACYDIVIWPTLTTINLTLLIFILNCRMFLNLNVKLFIYKLYVLN